MIKTAVALFVFNRPHQTSKVLKVLEKVQPSTLYIFADGPRTEVPDDVINCKLVRSLIISANLKGKVHTQFSTKNNGCRASIIEGLNQVFIKENQSIILEDDCLPDPSFFTFCESLLSRYASNENIMTICGHRSDGPDIFNQESYYFSKYPAIWGWATWRRTWEKFDANMTQWPDLQKTEWLSRFLQNPVFAAYWERIFNQNYNKQIDTWDAAFVFSCWLNGGLSVRTNVNMIQNLGFTPAATHTFSNNNHIAKRQPKQMPFPLQHPEKVMIQPEDEKRLEWVHFSGIDERRLMLLRKTLQQKKQCK